MVQPNVSAIDRLTLDEFPAPPHELWKLRNVAEVQPLRDNVLAVEAHDPGSERQAPLFDVLVTTQQLQVPRTLTESKSS